MTDDLRPPADTLRTTIDLNGEWSFVTDPTNVGVHESWYLPEKEWPDWTRTVDVPHVWQELNDHREYTGTAWYRTTVDTPPERIGSQDALLRFGAVDYEATVWVNGEHVGSNTDGFLPFELDVTEPLASGENTVCVAVTDPEDVSEIPHGKQGDPWYTRMSGIWQSVTLAFRPRIRITDVRVTPELATDTATVEVEFSEETYRHEELECHIRALRRDKVVSTAQAEVGNQTEVFLAFDDPVYWSPDTPTLYDLDVRLVEDGHVLDHCTDYFGMRSFKTADGKFLLNGDPITIRGVLEQGYYPKSGYCPPTSETFKKEVEVAKELGFNLIRKHVKPAHPDFVECADQKGILVWEEPANPIRYTDDSKQAVEEQVERLIDRDYNRPSVVAWSLYNEEWGIGTHDSEETLWTDEEKQQFLAEFYRSVRQRDPSRVVCDNSGWAHVRTDINDYHRYFPSPDRAAEWESDLIHIAHHPEDNYATKGFDTPDAPIVVSELGTWGFPDVQSLRDHYSGDPPWFDHEFLTPALKRAIGVNERFEASDLPDTVGDLDGLAAAWQHREFISIKHLLETTRTRERVEGYVLTQLSDIEWEFNGILDYVREKKDFHDEFALVNRAVAVVANLESHTGWKADDVGLRIAVVNDTTERIAGRVEWSIGDSTGSTELTVPPHSVGNHDMSLPLSSVPEETTATEELVVIFESKDWSASTVEPLTVVDRRALDVPPFTVFAESVFASRLASEGVTVTHELTKDVDIAFVDRISPEVDRFASGGGTVVHIPNVDGEMIDGGSFSYREIPEGESWIGVASIFYQDSPLLTGLCPNICLGWEFEGIYPSAVATGLDVNTDTIHVGSVEGWIENWSSPLVVRPHGGGEITSLTFRVQNTYGTHPVATVLCNRLIYSLIG